MEDANRNTPNGPKRAFDYLRGEAVDAHLAGDGMRVLHLCTIALEHLCRLKTSEEVGAVNLAEVRWAFFLSLYWILDDSITYSIEESFRHLRTDEISSWDQKLIKFLLTTLHIPVNFDSIDDLKDASADWLKSRSDDVEDLAAVSLTLEISWYRDFGKSDWRQLADAWLDRVPRGSPAHWEIEQIVDRLRLQSDFCSSGVLPNADQLPANATPEQAALVEAWKLLLDAKYPELNLLIRQLAGRIRVDSPVYPALFNVTHFSRIGRSSKESQFVSLSRVRFIESRQPAQACRQLRDERFESSFANMARKGFPDGVATERFTCFRMAMLNQLHALRSWDIGEWVLAEKQRAYSLLELAARGEVYFVKPAILALKNSLSVPDRGKYPHFDRSIELLDALGEEDRREIASELIDSSRVAWAGAHRILSELSDAIPSDMLLKVAKWSVRLDMDEHHAKWRHSWLGFWGNLLHRSDNAETLIEILKPALLLKAADFRCWDEMHATLCSAIIKGSRDTAQELLKTLIAANCPETHFEKDRYSVLLNVVRFRSEFAESAKEWLESNVEKTRDEFKQFNLRNIDATPETEIDDSHFRTWLRNKIVAECDKRLGERGPTVTIGIIRYHAMMFQLSWPLYDAELAEKLISVVDADYVPFANKGDPIACLAILAERSPKKDATAIVSAAERWLSSGIVGRELGRTSPLSTGQVLGLGADSIVPAMAYLVEALAEKHFDVVGERLTKWVIVEGIRQPVIVVDHTIRTALWCSIWMRNSDQPMAVALVGIAEGVANTAFRLEPAKVVQGFADVVLKLPMPNEVQEWLVTNAGRLCLELWERRLIEVSILARPSARESAAAAIRKWEKAGLILSPAMAEARDRLQKDCRLRVRKAIQ